MRTLFFILTLFCMAACNNSSGPNNTKPKDSSSITQQKDSGLRFIHTFTDTVLENKITDALMKLSFVKKADAYIDSFSNHQHGLAFMLDSLNKTSSEIEVQAGYNGDQRFETYFRFSVDPKTMYIKIYDAVTGDKLTVKEYLKLQH